MQLSHPSVNVSGMTTTSPSLGWILLYVTDVPASVRFYTQAVGLAVRFADDAGQYTEMETGATTFALCDRSLAADSSGLALSPPTTPTGNVTFVVDDVAAAFERAVAHGATAVLGPTVKPWGQTISYVRDPDGHLVELATSVPG